MADESCVMVKNPSVVITQTASPLEGNSPQVGRRGSPGGSSSNDGSPRPTPPPSPAPGPHSPLSHSTPPIGSNSPHTPTHLGTSAPSLKRKVFTNIFSGDSNKSVPTPPPPPPVDTEKVKQSLQRKPRASCQDFELRFFSSLQNRGRHRTCA